MKKMKQHHYYWIWAACKMKAGGRKKGASVTEVLHWKGKTKFDPMNKLTGVNGEAEVKQL